MTTSKTPCPPYDFEKDEPFFYCDGCDKVIEKAVDKYCVIELSGDSGELFPMGDPRNETKRLCKTCEETKLTRRDPNAT